MRADAPSSRVMGGTSKNIKNIKKINFVSFEMSVCDRDERQTEEEDDDER